MKLRWFGSLIVLMVVLGLGMPCFAASVEDKITEMISAYSMSSKGVQDPTFIEKVNELDNELREQLEKNGDIKPFSELLEAAKKLKAKKSARAMFEVALQKAHKRLTFTKAQNEVKDPDTLKKMDEMTVQIEKYLDPNLPDDETVDRAKLDAKRKEILDEIKKKHSALQRVPPDKRVVLEVTDEKGQPSKLAPNREKNLMAKLKVLVGDPGSLKIQIALKKDHFDMKIFIKDFVAPNGFAVMEGDMDFADIALVALDNDTATDVSEVLGDTYFKRYRCVQNDEQLNVMPNAGNTSYEMGSFMPGQVYKMEFVKSDGISPILKELEGNDQVQILNSTKAVREKVIEIKNVAGKNLIYLQGTDLTGLCSVKALGTLLPKEGHVTFKEMLLVVDDQLCSDLTRFVGENGINFFLKRASENLKKGMPFTPVLENLAFERTQDGKQIYIFSGRGKFHTN